jgi:hypothetical protein
MTVQRTCKSSLDFPGLFVTLFFNHLTYLSGSQCASRQCTCGPTSTIILHADLHQLSYESVTAKCYGWYDINGFCFRSPIFEASHPLVTTTNTRVVTRAIDVEGHESKYYEIIKNIIEYNFAGNKNLKTMFFDFDWFDPNHGTRENEFGMVEVKHAHQLRGCDPFVLAHKVEQVYYMSYPCEKLSAWWVVYRVNPRE